MSNSKVAQQIICCKRYYNVEYEPDPQVMSQDEVYSAGNWLVNCDCFYFANILIVQTI